MTSVKLDTLSMDQIVTSAAKPSLTVAGALLPISVLDAKVGLQILTDSA